MLTRRIVGVAAGLMVLGAALAGCGDDAAVPFTVSLSPEFVQGAVQGSVTGVLVTIDNESETDDPVELTVTATDAEATVAPAAIRAGEVAEVRVVAGPGPADRQMEIVVTGRRDGLEATASRSATVFDWEDDRGPYARTLLDLFTAWLAENRPELGITPATVFDGSMIAPGLLIVSHYLFLSDEWEVGLSWHVMTPPHDWADIYLRPRDELLPTLAFRLSSQDAALAEGRVEIAPTTVPEEVLR